MFMSDSVSNTIPKGQNSKVAIFVVVIIGVGIAGYWAYNKYVKSKTNTLQQLGIL